MSALQTFPDARHLGITIARTPADVYAFAVDPTNLPRWASGLGGRGELVEGTWVADSPMGRVTVRFVERNTLGVLDHEVTLPDGQTVYNPMRVVPNGEGSEVVFTLYRRPGVTDAELAADAETIARDLATLRALLQR